MSHKTVIQLKRCEYFVCISVFTAHHEMCGPGWPLCSCQGIVGSYCMTDMSPVVACYLFVAYCFSILFPGVCVCASPVYNVLFAARSSQMFSFLDGTFQATARFQDSNSFQKAIKMVLRCIFSVIPTFQDSNFNFVPPMYCDSTCMGRR